MPDTGSRTAPLIEVRDLTRRHRVRDREIVALAPVSFAVPRGEFVLLTGPSGGGKSTLLNLLALLDEPSAGQYRFAGAATAIMTPTQRTAWRRRRCGVVFQSFNLIGDLSARDNVALPLTYQGVARDAGIARADALLGRLGLASLGDRFPVELSGGEQQRIAVARAFVTEPDLILADEPTGNLDAGSADEIMTLLGEAHHRGTTVFLVSHDASHGRYATRVLHVRGGRVSEGEVGS